MFQEMQSEGKVSDSLYETSIALMPELDTTVVERKLQTNFLDKYI